MSGRRGVGVPVAPIERSDDLFNWQAGLIFKPTANTSLYASYATSSTPPNSLLGEGREDNGLTPGRGQAPIGVDDLKPQKTTSYEVGAKANLFGGKSSLSLAGFQTETDNDRVTGADNIVEFIGKQRISGIGSTAKNRKSSGQGKGVSVRVGLGGRRHIKKKKQKK